MNYITFIIPVFNEVKTLEKAINEVLAIKDIKKEDAVFIYKDDG